MKRFLLLIPFALLVTGLIGQGKTPIIQFITTSHNFGEITEEGGTVSVNFKLKNTGEAPLILNRVATSCGCTASDWTKEPIIPGAEGVVSVSYNPKGRPGPINQRITVYSNTPGGGIALSIRGQVLPRPKTKEDIYRRRVGDLGIDNAHLSMGIVYVNQIKTDTLKTYNFGSTPIEVSLEGVPAHVTIVPIPKLLEPGQEGYLVFTFNANKVNDWGYNLSRAQVVATGSSKEKALINITARLEEDFSRLTERELENAPKIEFAEIQKDFGNVKEGDVIEHEFIFTNTGKSDLVIRKIQASCGCTTVAPAETIIKGGKKGSLSASFKTRGYSGRQSKTITVITNDPKSTSIVLRLTGTVTKAE